MKVAFDSSVLVAAVLETHVHHKRAEVWLRAVVEKTLEGVLSRHALAETWAVLTRLPLKPKLSSTEALRVVKRFLEDGFTPIDMTTEVAAESVQADFILTFNVKHFLPLAEERSPTILAPPDPPSLDTR